MTRHVGIARMHPGARIALMVMRSHHHRGGPRRLHPGVVVATNISRMISSRSPSSSRSPPSLAPSASWCPQVPSGQATLHLDLAHDTQGLRRRLTGSRVFRKSGKPGKEKAPIIADRGLCVIGAKDFAPFLCFRLATKNPIQCCGHFVGLYARIGFGLSSQPSFQARQGF